MTSQRSFYILHHHAIIPFLNPQIFSQRPRRNFKSWKSSPLLGSKMSSTRLVQRAVALQQLDHEHGQGGHLEKSKIKKKLEKTPGPPSRSSQCAPRPSWWTPLATTAEPPSLASLRTSQSPRRSPAPEKIPPLLPSGGIVLQVPGCYLVFTKSYHFIWAPCELEIWNLPQKGSSGSHCPLSRQTLLVAPTTSWPASGQLRHSLLFQSLFKLNNN